MLTSYGGPAYDHRMDRPKTAPRPPKPGRAQRAAQDSDVSPPSESAGQKLLRAARLLDEVLVARLKRVRAEARPSHARLLPYVDAEGTRLTVLAARLGVTKQATGQLVEELEGEGLLVREADPEDGRAKRVKLTPRGKKAVSDVTAQLAQLEAGLVAALGEGQGAALEAMLSSSLSYLEAERRLG